MVTQFGPFFFKSKNDECSWNPKQPDFYGCFNWMIPNLYLGHGCFTKHPFKSGCLGFQVVLGCGFCWGLLDDFAVG